MKTDMLSAIVGALALILFLATMVNVNYRAWFHPSRFKEQEANRVKDWWPFANYFRKYHGSNEYLWAARIVPTIFLLFFLFLGALALLGYLGFIP